MNQELIDRLNKKCLDLFGDYEQGIYLEPYKVPNHIKEHVIYMRYVSCGASGGNCWGDEAEYFTNDTPDFKILDFTIEELYPYQLTISQVNQIQNLISEIDDCDMGYYGNYDDYIIKYVVLSELESLLNYFKTNKENDTN